MLDAARSGNWDQVVKLEGACALLISQLKHAAAQRPLGADEAQLKSRIMQRILVNDAEIRSWPSPGSRTSTSCSPASAARFTDPTRGAAQTMDTSRCRWTALAATHGGLDEFRLTSPREIAAMLQRSCATATCSLNLNGPDGSVCSARAVDGRHAARPPSASAPTPTTRNCRPLLRMRRSRGRRLPRQRQAAVRRAATWCWCTAARAAR